MEHCDKCKKNITEKENANVLAFLGVVPKTLCNDCYARKERGFSRHLLYFPKHPINSKIYIVGLLIGTIIISLLVLMMLCSKEFYNEWKNDDMGLIYFFAILLSWYWILHFVTKRKIKKLKK